MCSYEEEVQAMLQATAWITQKCTGEESVLIWTDSQSLCMALDTHNPETEKVRHNLRNHTGRITIQWIPGHADNQGKDAANLMEETRPITYRSACMMANQIFKDTIMHLCIKETYHKYDNAKEREVKTREQGMTLSKICWSPPGLTDLKS